MCGIFACLDSKDATKTLTQGLKHLEYRGYDSAGLAVFDKKKVKLVKVLGGVDDLEKETKKLKFKSSLGIGHTRWATHGAPSKDNAHPQKAGPIYLVHNGIIENAEEIKQIIKAKDLVSETDSEILAWLIHSHYKKKKDLLKASLSSLKLLKGSYASVCINEEKKGEVLAFKSGPPLALIKTKEGLFLSSDPQASKLSGDVLYLEDEQILHIQGKDFKLYDFKGKKVTSPLKWQKLKKQSSSSSKENHPHFMIKEILEQPKTLSQLIHSHIDKKNKKLNFSLKGNKKEFSSLIKKSDELLIFACGSSYYTALFAKYLLEDLAQIRVQVEIASEFIYRKFPLSKNTPALFISQSGETADTLSALSRVKKEGLTSLSLTNAKNSSLDRKSDFSFYMEAGLEVAVAAQKSFSASLLSLIFLGFEIRKQKKKLTSKEEKDFVDQVLKFPSLLKKTLSYEKFFLEVSEHLKKFQAFFYLGRGFYYPIALEGALKLKEIAYLHAEAYPSGEMKHGPLAMIDKNTALVILFPEDKKLYTKNVSTLKEVKSRGGFIISVGGKKEDKNLKKLSDYHLPLSEGLNYLHPLLSLIPLQMMAYYICRSYGYNADRPRNLAKSVTVE